MPGFVEQGFPFIGLICVLFSRCVLSEPRDDASATFAATAADAAEPAITTIGSFDGIGLPNFACNFTTLVCFAPRICAAYASDPVQVTSHNSHRRLLIPLLEIGGHPFLFP